MADEFMRQWVEEVLRHEFFGSPVRNRAWTALSEADKCEVKDRLKAATDKRVLQLSEAVTRERKEILQEIEQKLTKDRVTALMRQPSCYDIMRLLLHEWKGLRAPFFQSHWRIVNDLKTNLMTRLYNIGLRGVKPLEAFEVTHAAALWDILHSYW